MGKTLIPESVNIMKKAVLFLMFAGLFPAANAAEFDYMDTKNWHPRKNVTFSNGAIMVNGKAELYCRKIFPVDPAKRYIVKVTVTRTQGTKPSLVYVVLNPLDGSRRWISANTVSPAAGTETQLTVPVKSGDKVIFVKDASKWKLSCKGGIHYNAKADLSDLPNRLNLNSNPVKIQPDGKAWKIELDKPVKVSLPAGLTIRQANSGGYFHVGAKYIFNTHNFNASLQGNSAPPMPGKWWKGVEYTNLILLVNWNKEAKDNTVKITDISITEE